MEESTQRPTSADEVKFTRASFRRYIATSKRPIPTLVRRLYRAIHTFSLPAPRMIVKPMLWIFLTLRFVCFYLKRVLIAEPLFKAYCKQYGRNLHTDIYIHWIMGKGDIILGDNVLIDGKCSIIFARSFVDRPVLQFGNNSGCGHGCTFTVGKRIVIGRNCIIAPGCWILDSSGHPLDISDRSDLKPPSPDDVQEVVIEDKVWIGKGSVIFPGVRIGEGSIISAGSYVRRRVPPYSLVAGNPAKVICKLPTPSTASDPSRDLRPELTQ